MTLRRGISLLAVGWALVQFGSARWARAGQDSSDGDFDDPKLAREHRSADPIAVASPGTTPPPAAGVPPAAKSPPLAAVTSTAAPARPSAPPGPPPAVSPSTQAPHAVAPPPAAALAGAAAPASTVGSPPAGADLAERASPPATMAKSESATGAWPYAPRLKLGYRRFPFTRVGSASNTSMSQVGSAAPESFESLSLDVYPMSWYLRVGLSSQFGWESGQFDRTGDYLLAESASVGFQLPGRFTPFVEGLAGAGYMRRRQADDTTLPTAYWQTGIDAGVEIYVAGRAYASLAIGYLHPGNLFLMQKSLMSVNLDTWSIKLGFGI